MAIRTEAIVQCSPCKLHEVIEMDGDKIAYFPKDKFYLNEELDKLCCKCCRRPVKIFKHL